MSNFPLRLEPEIKKEAKAQALKEGCSLNSLIEKALGSYLNLSVTDKKLDTFKVACSDSVDTVRVKSILSNAGIKKLEGCEIDDSASFIYVKNRVMKAASYSMFKNLECKELSLMDVLIIFS